MLEDYDDNTIKVTRTLNNREVTLTTFGGQPANQPGGESGAVCFHFSKKGTCRRGQSCKFRHVERPTSRQVSKGQGNARKKQRVPSVHYRRPTPNRVRAQVTNRRLGLATTVGSRAIGPGSAGHPRSRETTSPATGRRPPTTMFEH